MRRRGAEERGQREMTGQKDGLNLLGFEGGGRGHEPRTVGHL